ncbi:MAG: hypothetical protein K940chlam7_01470 [Chlamydiae bacterium]|nr:hypothetical protein [Chlamydiota bacterium]
MGDNKRDIVNSNLMLYQTEDGSTRIEVHLQEETVWLSQKLMAELFQKNVRTINEHIQNIYEEGELESKSTIRKFRIVQKEGNREVARDIDFYNLDLIISVGYRVSSHRGTQFRIWATQRLKEYLVKGFILDDERLKQNSVGNYFEELLARIRDIRSSEKVFWRKVLDRLWHKEQREFQYTACGIAEKHLLLASSQTIPFFENMIRNKSWWGYCRQNCLKSHWTYNLGRKGPLSRPLSLLFETVRAKLKYLGIENGISY